MKIAVRIGYRHYVMSAAKAAQVMEALAGAECLESDWNNELEASAFHPAEPDTVSVIPLAGVQMTREEWAAYRARRDAEWEAGREAREAERAARKAAEEA